MSEPTKGSKKQKCEAPGCEGEASYCYHGSYSSELCEAHEKALDRYYHLLAARTISAEADDLAEATLAAIHAGMAEISDYITARKQARLADALVDKYIEGWIRDQATEG